MEREAEPRIERETEWMEARFARLEARIRSQQRLLGLTAAVALFGLVGMGTALVASGSADTAGDIITARSFVLVDDEGTERGRFGTTEDGAAQVALRDPSGADRLRMTVRNEGSPGLVFSDRSGNRRIVVGLLPDQTSTMVFADGAGSPRAVLGVSQDNRANLVFADQRGVTRAGLGVDERGVASLMLPDASEDEGAPDESGPAGGTGSDGLPGGIQ